MADVKTNSKRLLMVFKTTADKQVSIAIDNPRSDVSESEIRSVMTLILSSNVFHPNGDELAALVEAKIVVTNTNEYDLA